MSYNLRKFGFTVKTSAQKPKTTDSSASATREQSTPSRPADTMAAGADELKADILSSLKKDIVQLIRTEISAVMTKEFDSLRSELHSLKTEVANNNATIRSEVDDIKTNMAEMERGLSACSDDVTLMQTKISKLETEVTSLQSKCLDIEGRSRRNNIRIGNVGSDTPGSSSSSPAAVSQLLREVLNLDRDILVDRSHRGYHAKGKEDKPRVIVARLHYYQDRVDVIKRAREGGPLNFKGNVISINEDFPAPVAKARLRYREVKRLLRDRGIKDYGIIYPSRFFIKHKGVERQFQDADEAMAYVTSNVESSRPTAAVGLARDEGASSSSSQDTSTTHP